MNTSTLHTVGKTPIVSLRRVLPAESAEVLVKLEYFNPTGSYKDRMAVAMIEEAEARGDLRPGMTVVEFTGGSTGSSLAFVCAVKGYRLRVVSSDAFAKEKLKTMQLFGAELEIIPSEDGKITPDLLPRMRERARQIAEAEGAYFTNQFYNTDAIKGYQQIGRELLEQVERRIDGFCGGVGTAGMLMGVARSLREAHLETRIVALEPATSAVISTGQAGTHRVEGIGVGSVPPMLDDGFYDEAWGLEEEAARQMAKRLAKEEGILAGTSSGLNVVGALKLAQELGAGYTVVTIAVDTGLKYLSGDLFDA
jgi:cysteine synthase